MLNVLNHLKKNQEAPFYRLDSETWDTILYDHVSPVQYIISAYGQNPLTCIDMCLKYLFHGCSAEFTDGHVQLAKFVAMLDRDLRDDFVQLFEIYFEPWMLYGGRFGKRRMYHLMDNPKEKFPTVYEKLVETTQHTVGFLRYMHFAYLKFPPVQTAISKAKKSLSIEI